MYIGIEAKYQSEKYKGRNAWDTQEQMGCKTKGKAASVFKHPKTYGRVEVKFHTFLTMALD